MVKKHCKRHIRKLKISLTLRGQTLMNSLMMDLNTRRKRRIKIRRIRTRKTKTKTRRIKKGEN